MERLYPQDSVDAFKIYIRATIIAVIGILAAVFWSLAFPVELNGVDQRRESFFADIVVLSVFAPLALWGAFLIFSRESPPKSFTRAAYLVFTVTILYAFDLFIHFAGSGRV